MDSTLIRNQIYHNPKLCFCLKRDKGKSSLEQLNQPTLPNSYTLVCCGMNGGAWCITFVVIPRLGDKQYSLKTL